MLIQSTQLGSIEVDDDKIIDLQGGLLGFESTTNFVLIDADETGAYVWLQSVDDPNLAFLAVAPNFFFPDYEPDVPNNEAKQIGLTDGSSAQLLCLVTISDDSITANLMGPVVLNVGDRAARQVVLADQGYTTTEPLGIG